MSRGCVLLLRARAPLIHYLVSFFARAGRNSARNFLTIFVNNAHDIHRGKVSVDPFDPGGKQAGLALRDRPARTRINNYAPSHEIGRASCRERGEISWGGVSVKKNDRHNVGE